MLGVLESAGLRFDCLWVSGLTDEAWPLTARPNPFIPIAAQKKAGIPQASAEASAALDQRLTDEWKRAAAEVVFSWPAKDKDKDLAPSPLITEISMVVPAKAGTRLEFPTIRATATSFLQPASSNPSKIAKRRPLPRQGARRHARARRPGGVPVPRLRQVAPVRRAAGGARSPASTRATAASCCTR